MYVLLEKVNFHCHVSLLEGLIWEFLKNYYDTYVYLACFIGDTSSNGSSFHCHVINPPEINMTPQKNGPFQCRFVSHLPTFRFSEDPRFVPPIVLADLKNPWIFFSKQNHSKKKWKVKKPWYYIITYCFGRYTFFDIMELYIVYISLFVEKEL